MASASVNGTTLHYTEQGAGANVVLVHGFPLDARMWERQKPLADAARVIAPDLRGFGRSACNAAFTIESLADDIHALLQRIGALPCVLGGLSMGGYVALAYARKYASDLGGLMLFDTRAEGDTPGGKQGRMKMIDLVRASGASAIAHRMLPKLIWTSALGGAAPVGRVVRKMIESCPAITIEHALLAMRDRPDQSEFLPSIAVPTLIVVGEHDILTPPASSQKMHDLIAGSQLHTVANAGHMAPLEQPETVNAHIRRFLAALDPG